MTEGPDGGQGPQPDSWPARDENLPWQPSGSAPHGPPQPAPQPGPQHDPQGQQGPQGPPPAGGPQWQQPPPPPGAGWPPPGAPGGYGGATGPGMPGMPPGGPGGYGPPTGAPPWGGGPQPPYGFGPPTPRKKAPVIGIAVVGGLVVLLLIVVAVVALTGGSGDDPATASGKAAAKAGQSLAHAPGISYSGTYGGAAASFTVTKAASGRGSYTVHNAQVNRVDIGGVTYIKSSSAFWTAEGEDPSMAEKAAGKWSRIPQSNVDLRLADLSPSALATILQNAGNDPDATATSLRGTSAIKMTIHETTYYFSKSEPRRLMRIEGMAGTYAYGLDVTAIQASAMGPIFVQLRTDVQGLANAYDPGVTMTPTGKIQFGSCTETGCTVHGSVVPSGEGATPESIHIRMNVRFWGTGATVSTCSGTGTTTVTHATTISCRTTSKAWKSWYRSHNGRFTIHASSTYEATVNSAKDVDDLLGKLSQEQQSG